MWPLMPIDFTCRASLGALQWLAIQSKPQLCALLAEVVADETLETAREIQALISAVRSGPFALQFVKLPQAKHWTSFISTGDQARNNQFKGDSTVGLVTLAARPHCL